MIKESQRELKEETLIFKINHTKKDSPTLAIPNSCSPFSVNTGGVADKLTDDSFKMRGSPVTKLN